MERIANITGGEAYAAATADQLKNVYADIGSSVSTDDVDQDVTARYAGFGLGLAILAALA